MLIVRLIPFIAGAILIVTVVYYLGKRMGLWQGFGAGSKPVATKPLPRVSSEPARPAHEGLMEDIRHEVLTKPHNQWLYAVRSKLMLRVYTVFEAEGSETVHIDTIDSEDFGNRIQHDRVSLRVYSYKRGDTTGRMSVRSVLAQVIKPDTPDEHSEYDLGRGGDVAEGTPTVLATDDELRKMKLALRMATPF